MHSLIAFCRHDTHKSIQGFYAIIHRVTEKLKCEFIMQSLCRYHNHVEYRGKVVADTYRAGWMDRTLFDVVDEAYVVGWVPIKRVKHRIEFHRVD